MRGLLRYLFSPHPAVVAPQPPCLLAGDVIEPPPPPPLIVVDDPGTEDMLGLFRVGLGYGGGQSVSPALHACERLGLTEEQAGELLTQAARAAGVQVVRVRWGMDPC